MYNDFKYIIKRVLIGVGIGLILMLIKTNVFAMSYSWYYYNGSGWSSQSNALDNVLIINNYNKNYSTYFYAIDSNIKNSLINIGLSFYIDDVMPSDLDISIRYGTSSNLVSVKNYCSVFEDFEKMDEILMKRTHVNIYCNFTGSQVNADRISIGFTINNFIGSQTSARFSAESGQVIINPSESQLVISNDNYNTHLQMENDDYNTNSINEHNSSLLEQFIQSNQSCQTVGKSWIKKDNFYLTSNGSEVLNTDYGISDYIPLYDGTNLKFYTPITTDNIYMCFYTGNKNLISCTNEKGFTVSVSFPTDTKYFRLSFKKSSDLPKVKYCLNGTQGITSILSDVYDLMLQNGVINSSALGSTGTVSFGGVNIIPNGIVTNILTIPLRFWNNLNTNVTSQCVSLNLTSSELPFNSYINYGNGIQIKCIRLIIEEDVGFTYYEDIGTICGLALLFSYFMFRGRRVLKMAEFGDNEEGMWGGLN